MNLLVFSDSHGNRRALLRAVARQLELPPRERPDYLLFLGDGVSDFESLATYDLSGASLLAVKGNCDAWGASDLPEIREAVFANYRAVLTHGHRFSVKSDLTEAVRYAAEVQADLLLFGHTHIPHSLCFAAGETVYGVKLQKPLTVFNPGSIHDGSFGVVSLSEQGIVTSHGRV